MSYGEEIMSNIYFVWLVTSMSFQCCGTLINVSPSLYYVAPTAILSLEDKILARCNGIPTLHIKNMDHESTLPSVQSRKGQKTASFVCRSRLALLLPVAACYIVYVLSSAS